MLARLIGGLALVVGFAAPLAAQVSIKVVDADGRPLPAVRIDVLGSGEVIAVESTAATGIAELGSERWSEVRRISLSHLGFRTLIVQAEDIPTDGVLRLEPEPIDLAGLIVEAPELCPVVDQPEARRLWSDVASLYATDTGSRSWLAYLSVFAGPVSSTDLHRTSGVETVDYVAAGGGTGGVMHGDDYTPRPLDERIAAEGYAWPPFMIDGTTSARELPSGHRYPELERSHAHHFASPVFGSLHDFAMGSASSERTTLVFCGNGEGPGATVDGTITLIPGEAFVSAEWRFETSDPDEGAGGSASFASFFETSGSKPHLVAARGLFYRHDGTEPPFPDLPRTYARFGTASARWYLLPPGEKPCNSGLSFHANPPRPDNPLEIRFAACVAEHWGRE